MIINPHTGEIDESFITEIHDKAFPYVRISDAGEEFAIEYFYDGFGYPGPSGFETGLI